jgi:hypothetical protein
VIKDRIRQVEVIVEASNEESNLLLRESNRRYKINLENCSDKSEEEK